MSKFKLINTYLDGLIIGERKPYIDKRGSFSRIFCALELEDIFPLNSLKTQINMSHTIDIGVVRGMHYQIPPSAEKKIVLCMRGAISDTIVDIRKNSATFLKSYTINLEENDNRMVFIPEGFAHGFQTLSDNCTLVYIHNVSYSVEHERGLNPLDPFLGINWPLPISYLSEKDSHRPFISKSFSGV